MVCWPLLVAAVLLATLGCEQPGPPSSTPPDTVFVTDTLTITDTLVVPDTVVVTDTVTVVDTVIVEPPPPAPAAVELTGLPDSMAVGDTVSVSVALLDADGDELGHGAADWDVRITGALRYVSFTHPTNVVRAAAAGAGALHATHEASGLSAEATTQVSAPPDTTPGDTLAGEVGDRPDPVPGWPDNEPPGMTPVLAVDGSSKDWPGFHQGGKWADDDFVDVVIDPDSKYGFVIEKRFFEGDESGWHGINYQNPPGFGLYEELYFRLVFRLSENWQWHRSGGKYFYYGAGGQRPVQHILGWEGGGQIFWSGNGHWNPNGIGSLRRDVYHTLEIHHVASTDGANGSLTMWVDGVRVETFNKAGDPNQNSVRLENIEWSATRNLSEKRLGGIEAFMFWGGQNDTKRVDDWVRLSELYISGR